ncbi:hypothetical protein BDZ91DRAFT_719626, partial [Kalaharituber pfeilii]
TATQARAITPGLHSIAGSSKKIKYSSKRGTAASTKVVYFSNTSKISCNHPTATALSLC